MPALFFAEYAPARYQYRLSRVSIPIHGYFGVLSCSRSFALPSALQARDDGPFAALGVLHTWNGPVSNDVRTLQFRQHIGATDALRTGSYSKTLTFTLSTTTP